MPKTEAQKRARNKYEAKTYTIVGCKVRKEYAARFQAACYANNTTPATVLKAAIDSYLLNNSDDADAAASGALDARNTRDNMQ